MACALTALAPVHRLWCWRIEEREDRWRRSWWREYDRPSAAVAILERLCPSVDLLEKMKDMKVEGVDPECLKLTLRKITETDFVTSPLRIDERGLQKL
ncbi:hypothetical protein JAAARDRAFT_40075, partial [Jaapia argillacea MUCL 33604]